MTDVIEIIEREVVGVEGAVEVEIVMPERRVFDRRGMINLFLSAPADGAITLVHKSPVAFRLDALDAACATGSVDLAVLVDGVEVLATTTPVEAAAGGGATVPYGGTLTLVLSNAAATGLALTLAATEI